MNFKLNHYNCWYRNFCSNVDTEHCTDVCPAFYEMKYLFEQSGIPENLFGNINLQPDSSDIDAFIKLKGIKDSINDFVKSGKNLYIWSKNTGNGKTSWSIKLLQSYFHNIHAGNGLKPRGFFIHTPSFLIDCKHHFDNRNSLDYKMVQIVDYQGHDLLTMTNLLNIDVIVWDEIGSVNLTQYEFTTLLSILDQRCIRSKSNIFTSNLSLEQLENKLGDRIISRMNSDLISIELHGFDRRRGGNT